MISLADKIIACGASFRAIAGKVMRISAGSLFASEALQGACGATDGNYYVVGRLERDASYGDGYVGKLSGSGSPSWQRKLSKASEDILLSGVAEHSGGSVFAVGRSQSGVVNTGYLLKYSSVGSLAWQKTLSGSFTNGVSPNAIAISGSNVYVLWSGAGTNTTAILTKYDTDGNLGWQRYITVTSLNANLTSLCADSSGNVFVAGYDSSSPVAGQVMKYNSSGTLQWQKKFTNAANVQFFGVYAAADGNIYVAGACSVSSITRPLLVKLDSTGSLQWAKYAVVPSSESGQRLNAGADEALYQTTSLNTVIKWALDGTITWQRRWTTSTGTLAFWGRGVAGDNLLMGGNCNAWASNHDGLFGTFATSGTGTGTYDSVLTYAETTHTVSTISLTEATGTWTDAAGSATASTGSLTDAAITPTITVLNKTA